MDVSGQARRQAHDLRQRIVLIAKSLDSVEQDEAVAVVGVDPDGDQVGALSEEVAGGGVETECGREAGGAAVEHHLQITGHETVGWRRSEQAAGTRRARDQNVRG